jgi:hypothetical protein
MSLLTWYETLSKPCRLEWKDSLRVQLVERHPMRQAQFQTNIYLTCSQYLITILIGYFCVGHVHVASLQQQKKHAYVQI